MTETQKLIARIKAIAEKRGLSPSTIGERALGGGAIFNALESGRTITLAKYERALVKLAEMEAEDEASSSQAA
jgi:hypothetical protein